ncbi:hypothetical protein RI129_006270 [Pyrocoelia pectoralis]|uniref:Uncharacterized protein n=1 Tax=Pyrocoelia pectoralis TaxID=417401 RepID=A0AAN7VAX8_9COLE
MYFIDFQWPILFYAFSLYQNINSSEIIHMIITSKYLCDQTFFEHPVFIVIRQQKSITSWQIPMSIETRAGDVLQFASTSKTLCHNNMDVITNVPRNERHNSTENFSEEISIAIATSSKIPTSVIIRVDEYHQFYVEELKTYKIGAAASHPRYFYYKFPDPSHENYSSSVVLEITSKDTTCMVVSIQNASCPVGDDIRGVAFKGIFQTVQSKGGVIIKKKDYPNGFFIVFIVKGDNTGCNEASSAIPKASRGLSTVYNYTTLVSFQIKPTISSSSYYIAAFSTLIGLFIIYVIFMLSTWGFYRHANLWRKSGDTVNEDIILEEDNNQTELDGPTTKLTTAILTLNVLARKHQRYSEKKAYTYFWHVISIAIFYGIPVVQLVITYQRMVHSSGSLDFCYYNFLCAHPFFDISDFNHIYSNIGYVFMGILFLIITIYRHRYLIHKHGHGIPKHYGLFYAMGMALIMEGILSASYHVCPNQSNFQFDTSFMYVMAALCLVQLYQKRHPDINANAYATFVVLGIAIFSAMLGVLNGHLALWIVFILIYISFCLYVSFNIYFISYVKEGLTSVYDEWNEDRDVRKALEPRRKVHFIIIVVANILNIILACMGILCHFVGTDFATFLLGLLMGNTIMYAIVYIIMKYVNHEKLCAQPILFAVLGIIFWAFAAYFFNSNTSLWSVSAAESKEYNKHCIVLNFYDNHDVWHLLSSVALFFSFMLLLTLDDDVINTPHTKIMVF